MQQQVTRENAVSILNQARDAATQATKEYLDTHGDPEGEANGTAWVNVRPARGPLIAAAKALRIGMTSPQGGYNIWWEPRTRGIAPKEAGVDAFADVLQKYGVNVKVYSKMD